MWYTNIEHRTANAPFFNGRAIMIRKIALVEVPSDPHNAPVETRRVEFPDLTKPVSPWLADVNEEGKITDPLDPPPSGWSPRDRRSER